MSLTALYQSEQLAVSFELFPPKTAAGEETLYRHVARLMEFEPAFITCTYGAGGSRRSTTLDITERVSERFAVPVASHLTCVGSTVDELREYLSEMERRGIRCVVALRGDPPEGEAVFRPAAGGLRHASELVQLIRREYPRFSVAVGGYPEVHREAPSAEADLRNLKFKVDCGADVVLTQLFYDNNDFFRFRDRCLKLGIGVPVVPGILPVTNLSQIKRITQLCGARLPQPFVSTLAERDDPWWQLEVGVEFARRQVQQLVDAGVPGLHFYVLNKSQATVSVLKMVELPKAKHP